MGFKKTSFCLVTDSRQLKKTYKIPVIVLDLNVDCYSRYQQSNGYKPQPLDTHEIQLPKEHAALVDALARNTHNVWANEKVKRGWTFGVNEVSRN